MRFTGGRVVELGPEGRFEIHESGTGLVLNVAQGLVLTRNAAASEQPAQPLAGPSVELTILTPFGFTRVPGGDEISLTLTVNEKGATVDVAMGSIDLVDSRGNITHLGPKQKGSLGPPGQELNLEPMQVTIYSNPGSRAELKKKADAKWGVVPVKRATPVAEGDSFRVKGGRTVLQAPGGQSSYNFATGAEVTMEKAGRAPGECQGRAPRATVFPR